jgi:Asp-tRNA(Asn)/Glu-tRNA(Gln) amidotransferase A subunit family amidase
MGLLEYRQHKADW